MANESCPTFPTGKVREMIEKTADTRKEHAIVRCSDGSTSEVVSGEHASTNVAEQIESCDLDAGPVDVIHTHPNDVNRLSDQDRKVAASDAVGSVCVATTDGRMTCEMVESCTPEIEQ